VRSPPPPSRSSAPPRDVCECPVPHLYGRGGGGGNRAFRERLDEATGGYLPSIRGSQRAARIRDLAEPPSGVVVRDIADDIGASDGILKRRARLHVERLHRAENVQYGALRVVSDGSDLAPVQLTHFTLQSVLS